LTPFVRVSTHLRSKKCLTPELLPPLFQLRAGQRRIVNKGPLDPFTDGLVLVDDFDLRVLQIGDVETCRVVRAAALALAASPAATSVALVLDHAD
jgi:hypothetical protein